MDAFTEQELWYIHLLARDEALKIDDELSEYRRALQSISAKADALYIAHKASPNQLKMDV